MYTQWNDPPARRMYLRGGEIRALLLLFKKGSMFREFIDDDTGVWKGFYRKLGGDSALASLYENIHIDDGA